MAYGCAAPSGFYPFHAYLHAGAVGKLADELDEPVIVLAFPYTRNEAAVLSLPG